MDRGCMKRIVFLVFLLVEPAVFMHGAALGTSSRAVIPSEVQQIISVDYRTLRNSPTALSLKERVLPDNLKQFETALKSAGVDENDVDQLTFALFRTEKNGLKVIGVANGQFSPKVVLAKFKKQKVVGQKYKSAQIFPLSGTQMAFLDDYTMLFGDMPAIKAALDARNGDAPSLGSNAKVSDLIGAVEGGPIWSVLDDKGSQNMLRSALGDVSKLADYDMVKKRLIGSRYQMDFNDGVNFNLDVITSDNMTAATLSSMLQVGKRLKENNATGIEKLAMESMAVDSDSNQLKIHFKTDDKKFETLLRSDLFASVSR
jgi:hypothetical protein